MKTLVLFILLLSPCAGFASTAETIDACINGWKNSPFKIGKEPDQIVSPSVKVFGIGKKDFEDNQATKKPRLILIMPNVNVLGSTSFRLMNPNGWYCFKTNVSVLGKIAITAHCKAHIANSASGGGANILGADESDSGVTVLGSLRIQRVNCDSNEKKPKVDETKISSSGENPAKE